MTISLRISEANGQEINNLKAFFKHKTASKVIMLCVNHMHKQVFNNNSNAGTTRQGMETEQPISDKG